LTENEERVVIRAPAGTTLAIEQAAQAARMRPSDFVRMVLLEALASNGVRIHDPSVSISDLSGRRAGRLSWI